MLTLARRSTHAYNTTNTSRVRTAHVHVYRMEIIKYKKTKISNEKKSLFPEKPTIVSYWNYVYV